MVDIISLLLCVMSAKCWGNGFPPILYILIDLPPSGDRCCHILQFNCTLLHLFFFFLFLKERSPDWAASINIEEALFVFQILGSRQEEIQNFLHGSSHAGRLGRWMGFKEEASLYLQSKGWLQKFRLFLWLRVWLIRLQF